MGISFFPPQHNIFSFGSARKGGEGGRGGRERKRERERLTGQEKKGEKGIESTK